MNQFEIIGKTYNFAEKYYAKDDIHGFPHVLRVLKIAERLANEENADLFVVKMATLLHDIGRMSTDVDYDKRIFMNLNQDSNHAELSSEIAQVYIVGNFDLDMDVVDNITHSIRAHSFSNEVEPKTLEAKILSDADKIDGLGAIGLYRTIGFQVKYGSGIDGVIKHLRDKILKLEQQVYLRSARIIAKEKTKIINDFYSTIEDEILKK